MTKRSLLLGLARSTGVEIDVGASREVQETKARRALGKIGIRIEGKLDDPVTERDLVEVGKAVGASVRSSDPDRKVTEGKGHGFIQALSASVLAAKGGKQGDFRPSCQGRQSRANRKGRPASPASPNATAPPCP